jgi:phosphoglycerate dehydrogenase-like enzyme
MSDQPFVLAISVDDDPQLEMLRAVPHVLGNTLEGFGDAVRKAEVILHWAGSRDLLRSVFLSAPNVRWVHSRSAGLDKVLFPELVESAVPLTNGSGVFSASLGEFALTAMLFFAKDLPRMRHNQRARRWEQFDVEMIAARTVGIVGYGDIGRAVAARAHAMGMTVLALKRHLPAGPDPLPDPVVAKFFPPSDLSAMLAVSDYVVVSAPLTPETRHMISDAAFAAMKPTAVLINVGRGPVVDQAALVRALEGKRIRGAGLDVFEQEPIPPDDPIWSFENVLVSPHCADHTRDWLNDAMRFFLVQYERFRKGEPLKNIIEKHLGY